MASSWDGSSTTRSGASSMRSVGAGRTDQPLGARSSSATCTWSPRRGPSGTSWPTSCANQMPPIVPSISVFDCFAVAMTIVALRHANSLGIWHVPSRTCRFFSI